MKNMTSPQRYVADLPLLNGRQDEYLRYLGFQRNPFPVAPDVEHLFVPPRTDMLLTEILHGIYTRKGFMVITGEVGLGKTTLSQHILNVLEEYGKIETALVLNTFLQGTELLGEIIRDFGIQSEESTHQGQLMVLNNFMIERYRSGINCVLIIDDAQNLSLESLELVRMISNLETDASKLVQILLVGQPEFQEKLETHSLRQLKSRIMIHSTVEPLDRDALRQYVYFKMSAAGGSGGVAIPENCFSLMHKLTAGNPRLVNRLMDRMLYGLFAYNTTRLSKRLLLEVATEIGLSAPKAGWWPQTVRVAVATLTVVGLINVLFLGKQWLYQQTESNQTEVQQIERQQTEIQQVERQQTEIQQVERQQTEVQQIKNYNIENYQAELASSAIQNEEAFVPAKQPAASAALPEVRQFLEYYGLENYTEAFTQALGADFEPIAQRIVTESGYRLVQIPELTLNIRGRYRILRLSSAEGVVKRLLFWRPNYWIDSFVSGEKSEKILALQKQLAHINLYNTNLDGIVGNQTIVSLTGFQKRLNLPVTGLPDAATLFLLSQIAGELQWNIQISSLQRLESASALVESLSSKGFKSFAAPSKTEDGQEWQVVWVGPMNNYNDAETQLHDIMTKLNLTGKIIQSLSVENKTTRKG